MKVMALSDIHIDHPANRAWIDGLSPSEHRSDLLLIAGDVSDSLTRLAHCFKQLTARFAKVLFVPGNHELWVMCDGGIDSFAKFRAIERLAAEHEVSMRPFHCGLLSIVPLLSWYDYSFGEPCEQLHERWMDFHACRWPGAMAPAEVCRTFLQMNERSLLTRNRTVISFSHFVPRPDLLEDARAGITRLLHPVMGSLALEAQVRRLAPDIHVYGHSHRRKAVTLDGTLYVNHAAGYPAEQYDGLPTLRCVHEFDPVQQPFAISSRHS